MSKHPAALFCLFFFVAIFSGNTCLAKPARRRHRHVWGPTTSGPFFTGTAEVEPRSSWYWEPYLFDSTKTGSSSLNFNQKFAIGLGHRLEFDGQLPLILNLATPASAPPGTHVSAFGPGDAHLNLKYQLTADANTFKLWARPAIGLTADLFIPTGNASGLKPALYGVDQTGNGTFQEGLSLLMRKRVQPFLLYAQVGDLIQNPADVPLGYGFNNGIGTVTSPSGAHLINGNLVYYSAALEYVLDTHRGIGFLAELDGQSQSSHNMIFGAATAPSFSYLFASPELEVTWPAGNRFAITWGGGVNLPVETSDYQHIVTPMMTVTFSFNGPNGNRNTN